MDGTTSAAATRHLAALHAVRLTAAAAGWTVSTGPGLHVPGRDASGRQIAAHVPTFAIVDDDGHQLALGTVEELTAWLRTDGRYVAPVPTSPAPRPAPVPRI